MRSAVFLDRDGTINKAVVREGKPYPPSCSGELELLPGVTRAVNALHDAGFLIIVVTNQPDVATGIQRREVVEEINDVLRTQLPIDDIRVCYDADDYSCECRKPKPGLLIAAAREHHIDLASSFMVGDRWRDVEAGKAAGCYTIFIDSGYRERQPDSPHAVVRSLAEAIDLILVLGQQSIIQRARS